MANYMTTTSDKSKKTALICCLIGGLVGAHRYYVGRIGSGLIYTLTFGWMGIGTFIDLITILVGGFRDVSGAPLRQ